MAQVGYGPLQFVDGPLPAPPRYSLLSAAREVNEAGDRWINGTSQWNYGAMAMGLHDPCNAAVSSAGHAKGPASATVGRIDTGTITQWLVESCTSVSVNDDQAYRERAARIFAAREHYLVELELQHAALLPSNPHLSDANVTQPNGTTATSPVNGLELLEQAIAASKQAGFIHCTPGMLVAWSQVSNLLTIENGKVLSPNGNVIVPGQGYDKLGPDSAPAATGTQEWAYASGPVEVRKSDIIINPDTMAEALDRAQNNVTYYAERYYNIVWSPLAQAAVKIDRCLATCS